RFAINDREDFDPHWSLLAQEEVQHPAAADMWPRPAAVVQDVSAITPRLFQGIAKDGKPHRIQCPPRRRPIVIASFGNRNNGRRLPSGVDSDGTEGIAEDVSQQGNTA